METANEFLEQKGFKKVYQRGKRYNVTIGEMIEFLNEYANRTLNEFIKGNTDKKSSPFLYLQDRK
jgi:hypothetical protein